MPQNVEDNQSQNWRELDTALDNLTISLRPFVKRELRNKFTIVEVYEIHSWHPVDKSKWYKGETDHGRQCFGGIVASDKAELIGKTVRSYINPRAQNPVKYVNC